MSDVRFETFGLNARLLSPPKPMGRIHHHHEMEINFLFSGGVTYLHRGAMCKLMPRRLTMFWGSTPHSLVAAEPGSEMAWITVPLAWVWSWALPRKFIRGLMEGRWWTAPTGSHERFPVRAWVEELEDASPSRHERLLLELHACFLWMAEQAATTSDAEVRAIPAGATGGLHRIERMARFMAERFQDSISVADVAAAAELHPNYAMPLFQRHCGVTIHDYLMQYRLTHAQWLLLTTDEKIIDVALASGFGSLSSFYEAFTRIAKEPPQTFRRRMRA
ncbi:MAG: helix-turn-helix domain-containing protein [Opitutaceae bacterium]|nr:helix-turn-helix domain-containing protein [Opitutaceae bacterium]